MSQGLRLLLGSTDAGAIQDLPWDAALLAGPHPPNVDTPLLVGPDSPVWTLRFLLQRVHHRLLGGGGYGWTRGGAGSPGQAPAAGGSQRVVGVATGVAWEEMGGDAPPPEKGVKMFELAQLNLFTPEGKKGGGGTHWCFIANCWQGLGLGGMEYGARDWTWTPTSSALTDMGGFDPEAANRGAYAGTVHGIASQPKAKPKPAATPAIGAPPQPHPPNPREAFGKALGAMSPATAKAGYVDCVLSLI